MTPAQQAGYHVGSLAVATHNCATFSGGSVIELIEDDGTDTPRWKLHSGTMLVPSRCPGCDCAYANLSNVRKHIQTAWPNPDLVNSPPHYTQGSIECIDAMEACSTPGDFRAHCRLTAMKYIWRALHKGSEKEQYEKAKWYLERAISSIDKETKE